MNKYRIEGLFTLDNNSFNALGDIVLLILNHIKATTDYESCKILLTIIQTLYMTAIEPNKPRIFLQKTVINHSLWKDFQFWEDLIKCIL